MDAEEYLAKLVDQLDSALSIDANHAAKEEEEKEEEKGRGGGGGQEEGEEEEEREEDRRRASLISALGSHLGRGRTENQVECQHCGHVSRRVEDFTSLQLGIDGCGSVEVSELREGRKIFYRRAVESRVHWSLYFISS